MPLSLYTPLVACLSLTPAEWQRVPSPCPGLGSALPAVLARSAGEAALLVRHLPGADRERLCAAALCLRRLQQCHGLPPHVVRYVLAAAAGEPDPHTDSTGEGEDSS